MFSFLVLITPGISFIFSGVAILCLFSNFIFKRKINKRRTEFLNMRMFHDMYVKLELNDEGEEYLKEKDQSKND